ncbi:prepilin-type N-terminal cleavage/methylation domain-containing protein [Microbacterium sp. CFH 90308]|uniref:Prepilin-type N-terminal cleavage/methylation domain-containing protein n=1 Tax=Microbacterium salsuginis TaxID=2722803 RepID=A0ABX1KH69_9MICO|nr:prepilin-type N-terminal cleavage/methylation domain-containing protein [Microbacterium sp. CFH 90308]NLP85910.1 prepilin-type N-terminal cleavage/methylation domain-containing protein [Microbacterium sp. CFH 90308]
MTHPRHIRDDDTGLSLIELIVALVVGGIVIGAMATIFINTWKTQEEVTTVSQATSRGQLVGSTIERALRNATEYQVTADGTELRVYTTLGGSLECQGFRLTAGSLRMSSTSIASGGLAADATTWPEWQTGIAARGTTPFLEPVGSAVTYTFDVTTESASVRFAGEASARTPLKGDDGGCW